jgi:hypothetical protein
MMAFAIVEQIELRQQAVSNHCMALDRLASWIFSRSDSDCPSEHRKSDKDKKRWISRLFEAMKAFRALRFKLF